MRAPGPGGGKGALCGGVWGWHSMDGLVVVGLDTIKPGSLDKHLPYGRPSCLLPPWPPGCHGKSPQIRRVQGL